MAALEDYDFEGSADRIEEMLTEYYPLVMGLSYEGASGVLPVAVSFDVSNPRVKDVIGELAKKIRGVSDTTREDVRRIVDEGTANGSNITDIAEQIRSAVDISDGTRARMIARTETAHAYSAGSVLAYKDAGVEKKQWLATEDGNEDADCAGVNGEIVGVDEDFSVGVPYPPLHPNCRCACAPVVE